MAQIHFYVPSRIETELRQRAEARGLSLSRYVAEMVTHDLGAEWPEGYFEEVVGGWQGEPLVRPPQGEPERRDELD